MKPHWRCQGGADTYLYLFDWDTLVDGGHRIRWGLDLTWIAFAKTGNPNNTTIPDWPAYDKEARSVMVFDIESKVVNDF